ncbi:MAG: LUD domain-containing protein [Bacteroidia bacterium]
MQESLTKEKILKKIRAALIEKTPHPFPKVDTDSRLFNIPDTEREIVFAEAFKKLGGNFLFAENHLDFVEDFLGLCESKNWQQFFCLDNNISAFLDAVEFAHIKTSKTTSTPEVVITTCECLIAQSGTIVMSGKLAVGTSLPAKSKVLIILAGLDQLTDDMKDAMHYITLKYNKHYPSSVTLLNGPFKTIDDKNNLQEVYLFLVENNNMLKLHELE